MTKKLFWTHPYEKEFEATIIAVKKKGVVLDQTLFYPRGGGQSFDRGILKVGNLTFEVKDVLRKDDEIIHYIPSKYKIRLKVGDKVRGVIDWVYRYVLMKAHTSQHIFSADILKKDLETKGDPNVYNIAELGVGLNPKCKMTGIMLDDEGVLGSAHIGIGSNLTLGGSLQAPIHYDLVLWHPTIKLDGTNVIKNGKIAFSV